MNASTREQGRTGRTTRAGGALELLAPIFHRQLDRLDRGIAEGSLELLLPNGRARLLGGRADGPAAVVDLRSWRALLRLALSGSIGWYEAWAAGEWASPDPVQLFALFSRNRAGLAQPARADPFLVPDVGDAALLADPRLVHEPQLDPRRPGVLARDRLDQAG